MAQPTTTVELAPETRKRLAAAGVQQVVQVYVMVDSDGNHVVHLEQSELVEEWENQIGDYGDGGGERAYRIVKVEVEIPLPKVDVLKVNVQAPAEVAATEASATLS